ncbi:MAG: phosphoesterase PA-phosphatase related protein [Bryobacterales bacterium]|jgi:PAP2 superfamily protein|nr:phosphoesterase PA-phosphatase related protein [Bryobacterales bacterium]
MVFDSIDRMIVTHLNHFAGRSTFIDAVILLLADEALWAVLLVCCLWYFWFRKSSDVQRVRERLLAGVLGTAISGAVSRILQVTVHSHARPLHDPSLGFHVILGVDPEAHNHWNSFPSDHAAIYFALATITAGQSRVAGGVAYILAFLSAFARVYAGYHWPSDIFGGAATGIACVLLTRVLLPSRPITWALQLESRKPAAFYSAAFLLCYMVATLFIDTRDTARVLMMGLKGSAQLKSSL